jgi:hypothetical protein
MYTRPLKKLNLKKKKMARSTGVRNPPKLLLTKRTFDVFILISVKWNLSSHILYFIYMQRLAIQFLEMHCTRTHICFFYKLISIRVTIAFYLSNYLQTDTCLQLKKITTVFLFQLLQFDYEVWEIIIYFTTCFSFWSLFYTDFLQRI